jgi:hypothetical protein
MATVATSVDAAPKKSKKPKTPSGTTSSTTATTTETTDAKKGDSDKKSEEASAEFDKQAAVTAIGGVSLHKCKATNAAKGEGHVMITFAPSGGAQSATIDRGPWVGTPVAKCMAKEFKKATVPAFKGEPITVGKVFQFE